MQEKMKQGNFNTFICLKALSRLEYNLRGNFLSDQKEWGKINPLQLLTYKY